MGPTLFNRRRGRAFQFFFCLLFWAMLAGLIMGCSSVSGPPFPEAPAGETLPHQGYFRFEPSLQFYQSAQLGEVYLVDTQRRDRTLFYLRILGRDRKNNLRIRQYEGAAVRFGPRAEFRVERCYIFGKKGFEDRLAPLQRWDCDHLVFHFESPSNFARRDALVPVPGERMEYSEWFAPATLEPLPLASDDRLFFAGQLYPLSPQESAGLEGQPDAVVWGYEAGRLLRNGQILNTQNERGEATGSLQVISRVSDFILCRWIDEPGQDAAVAYTRESLLNPPGGLFGMGQAPRTRSLLRHQM